MQPSNRGNGKGVPAFRHSKRTAWRETGGEAVIVDLESGAYFSLTGPGLRAWRLIGEGRPLAEIADALAADYSAEPRRVRKDLDDLAGELRKERLIEPCAAAAAPQEKPARRPAGKYVKPVLSKYGLLSSIGGPSESLVRGGGKPEDCWE